jgi:hypothetical protein
MPYLIPKEELPQMAYRPAKCHDETVMFGLLEGQNGAILGPVIMYLDVNETRFCSWDEIIEWAATADIKERKKPELPKDPEKKAREVKPK